MDITFLANSAISILGPALPVLVTLGTSVSDAMASKAVEGISESAVKLWQWLFEDADEKTLDSARDVVRMPEDSDAVAALRLTIKKLLSQNEQLAIKVAEIVGAANIQVTASGKGSIAIGGNVGSSSVSTNVR